MYGNRDSGFFRATVVIPAIQRAPTKFPGDFREPEVPGERCSIIKFVCPARRASRCPIFIRFIGSFASPRTELEIVTASFHAEIAGKRAISNFPLRNYRNTAFPLKIVDARCPKHRVTRALIIFPRHTRTGNFSRVDNYRCPESRDCRDKFLMIVTRGF